MSDTGTDIELSGIAPAAIEAVQRLGDEVTPAAVLDAARPVTSPLHAYFTWDDAEAAEGFRLVQAAALIRRIRVQVVHATPDGPRAVTVRAYQVTDRGQHVYRSYGNVMADPDASERLMQTMLAEWAMFRRRWERYAEFREVFGGIELPEVS